jgi:hypothetical protein
MDQITLKALTLNVAFASLLVFNRVYRLEMQSAMLVFSTPLVTSAPLTFSLVDLPPPFPCVNKYSGIYSYNV